MHEAIGFLLNKEEAHNKIFKECLNKVGNTGSNQDLGLIKDF